MRCFMGCFSSSKRRRNRHLVNGPHSNDHNDVSRETSQLLFLESMEEVLAKEPIRPISESREKKLEEEPSYHEKKKVTFDLCVKTCEDLSSKEVTDKLVVNDNDEKERDGKEEILVETKPTVNSLASNVSPPNYRYQNCAEGEEYEDLELEDSGSWIQEESSESLFSLSIDSRKQGPGGAEGGEKEVTSSIPNCGSTDCELKATGFSRNVHNRSQNDDSVLGQIENLTQLASGQSRAVLVPFQHQDKENINVEPSIEPNVKLLIKSSRTNAEKEEIVDPEVAVDTSLSSWLVESETTPNSKSSPNSVKNSPSGRVSSLRNDGEKAILGAIRMEESKQGCASSSPRRSRRSHSPDEMPDIGTVGSYWRHTGRAMDLDSASCL